MKKITKPRKSLIQTGWRTTERSTPAPTQGRPTKAIILTSGQFTSLARLLLARAVGIVLKNALNLLGVDAPDKM